MEIINIVQGIQLLHLNNLPLRCQLRQEDVRILFIDLLQKALDKAPSPEKTNLHVEEVSEVNFSNKTINISTTLIVENNQVLLPKKSTLYPSIHLNYGIEDGHLKVQNLDIQVDTKSKGIAQNIVSAVVKTFLFLKEKDFTDAITKQLNLFLNDTNTWLPFVQAQIPNTQNVNYEIKEWSLSPIDNLFQLDFIFSAHLNSDPIKSETTSLVVELEEESIKPVLLSQINAHIPDMPDTQVEFSNVAIIEKNGLFLRGTVEYGSWNVDFDCLLLLVFNTEEQLIQVQVQELKPLAGFIIRNGFKLFQGRIIREIEEKARIEIASLLESFPLKLQYEAFEKPYQVNLETCQIEDLYVQSEDGIVRVHIDMKTIKVQLMPVLSE